MKPLKKSAARSSDVEQNSVSTEDGTETFDVRYQNCHESIECN